MTCRVACTIQQLSVQAIAWQVWPPNALFLDMQYTDEASHKPVRAVKVEYDSTGPGRTITMQELRIHPCWRWGTSALTAPSCM